MTKETKKEKKKVMKVEGMECFFSKDPCPFGTRKPKEIMRDFCTPCMLHTLIEEGTETREVVEENNELVRELIEETKKKGFKPLLPKYPKKKGGKGRPIEPIPIWPKLPPPIIPWRIRYGKTGDRRMKISTTSSTGGTKRSEFAKSIEDVFKLKPTRRKKE